MSVIVAAETDAHETEMLAIGPFCTVPLAFVSVQSCPAGAVPIVAT